MAGKFLAWWKTVPGILTAAAGIITALAGLIVALNQIGVFGGNSKQGSSMESKSETREARPRTETVPSQSTSSSTGPSRKYPANLAAETEITVGPIVYKILSAKLDTYSENKLSLSFSMRFTNTGSKYDIAVVPNNFRMHVDGIPLAPEKSFMDAIAYQSAKEGEVMFVRSLIS